MIYRFRIYFSFIFKKIPFVFLLTIRASTSKMSTGAAFSGPYSLYVLSTFPGRSITVELVGKQVRVSQDMAIFITMNPGYAGRSNLPDNLKKLFRSLAMTTPDRQLIAEVMLFSQGFRTAEKLACKIVPFFK